MGRKESAESRNGDSAGKEVGVGVIIQNVANEILIGKRIGSHAPLYSIPGGHLENGESFEAAAIKEVFEETGLIIYNPKVICVTNNIRTYQNEGKHYISVNLFANEFSGQLEVKEKNKCEWWKWFPLNEVPQPQFDASVERVVIHSIYWVFNRRPA